MKAIIMSARALATLAVVAAVALLWRKDPELSLCLVTFIGAVMLEGVAQEESR